MRFRTLAVVVPTTALIVTALAGCTALQTFAPTVTSDIFTDTKDMAKNAPAGFTAPTWVPADATVIRVDFSTAGDGAMIMYTSKTHFADGTCTAKTAIPKPTIQDTWWPDKVPADAQSCPGGWAAFAVGDQVYGWTGSNPRS